MPTISDQHMRFALFLLTKDCKSSHDVELLLGLNDESSAAEVWRCAHTARREFKRGDAVAYPKGWRQF